MTMHSSMRRRLTKGALGSRMRHLALALCGTLFLAPLVVTLTNSFMSEAEIALSYTTKRSVFDAVAGLVEKFAQIRLVPREVTVVQYGQVLLYQPAFLGLLLNSVKLTLPVAAGNLLVSLTTAYGFAIWRWKHKEAVFAVFVVVMLMPLQAVLVPNYIVADILRLSDYAAIILPGIFSPFGIFLMRQSMKSIPPAYYEAARIDGAGEWRTFLHVVAPQMKSAMAALFMLVFVEYWNLVEQAVVFIGDYTREPLSVYLSRIADGRVGLIFAASCVYMIPPFWCLVMGQEDLEKGIELSGVK